MENRFGQYWRRANQWFYRTADRALDEAYKAALKIKAIEDEHFGGGKIEIPTGSTGNQIATYFQTDLTKYLNITRIRLAEFQTSRTLTGNDFPQPPESQQYDRDFNSINPYIPDIDREARILEKLSFIDDILTRYADRQTVGQLSSNPPNSAIQPGNFNSFIEPRQTNNSMSNRADRSNENSNKNQCKNNSSGTY